MAYQEIALRLTSTDTFDLVGSSLTVQIRPENGHGLPSLTVSAGAAQATFRTKYEGGGDNGLYVEYTNMSGDTSSDYILNPPDNAYMFFRLSISGNNLVWSTSLNGSSFTTQKTLALSDTELLLFKSARVIVGNAEGTWGISTFTHIGSINPSLKPANAGAFLQFF